MAIDLLSNHNCVKLWDFSNENTTHCCIQDRETFRVPHFQELYHKPVIYDECCYEGNIQHNWGNISGFELVNRFWNAFVQGGYCTHGETFMDENDVLWWAKGGKLYGESPARIGFLRGILEELPGDLDVWYGQMDGNWRQMFAELKKDPSKAAGGNIFIKLLAEKAEDDMERFMADHRGIQGRCGNEAFLKYYGRSCTSLGVLELPSDGSYDVEVIDIWEMTRTHQLTGVNGKVEVKLPGKEGIAVLAQKR